MTDSLGLDFGTTNTVMAHLQANGQVEAIRFPFESRADETLRTALAFHKSDLALSSNLIASAGSRAIQQFIDDPWDTRFLQSFKTFAASPQFSTTAIFTKRFNFEDLLETFLSCALRYADQQISAVPQNIIMGRPVNFAGSQPDEALAIKRYEQALRSLGAKNITYVYEPVAAAYFFVRNITKPCTVLVADFGGGTSDFSIVNFSFENGRRIAKALGHSGIGIAGDHFDYRIIDQVLLPELGKGTSYKSMSGTYVLPRGPFASFARWNQLSILKTSREFADLKKLQRHCEAADQIQKFIDLVDENQGYPLYKAVSEAKMQLSTNASTTLKFAPLGQDFAAEIKRQDFERWIAEDIERIEQTLTEALQNASTAASAIDHVFLTGGTSFVPAVRKIFTSRFSAERISGGDEFNSIAGGLAMIAGEPDPSNWAAPN